MQRGRSKEFVSATDSKIFQMGARRQAGPLQAALAEEMGETHEGRAQVVVIPTEL